MRILNLLLINRFILGNWILRSTNDNKLKEGYTFLVINDDDTVKLKTIYNDNIVVYKRSISGNIKINNTVSENILLNINYNRYTKYTHSIFGIQLPELIIKKKHININKKYKGELVDNSLLITDTRTPLYYLFDLQINKFKSPYIEISLYTFIFSQFIGILLSNIL